MKSVYRNTVILASATAALMASAALHAQKSGQSMSIQYGVVVSSTYVQEKSDAGKAALVGGAVGYGLTRNKSSSRKALGTATGAVVGGAAKSRSEGDREARQYEVATQTGTVVIISDQTEIHVDDCVAVESAGKQANIRRVPDTYCDPASAEAVAAVQDEAMEEAQECAAIKQELAAATTQEEFDLALRKHSMLCDM